MKTQKRTSPFNVALQLTALLGNPLVFVIRGYHETADDDEDILVQLVTTIPYLPNGKTIEDAAEFFGNELLKQVKHLMIDNELPPDVMWMGATLTAASAN